MMASEELAFTRRALEEMPQAMRIAVEMKSRRWPIRGLLDRAPTANENIKRTFLIGRFV